MKPKPFFPLLIERICCCVEGGGSHGAEGEAKDWLDKSGKEKENLTCWSSELLLGMNPLIKKLLYPKNGQLQ